MIFLSKFIDIVPWDYFAVGLQIFILFVAIYWGLFFIRGTRAANVLAGIIVALLLFTVITEVLKLTVLLELLSGVWTVFPIAIVVIFQPELRRAFAQIGSSNPFSRKQRREETISEIVIAATNMSRVKVGALIVFQRQIGMRAIVSSGVKIDARVSHKLLETIFAKNTALHDGGVAIENDRIMFAHCIFPLSQNSDLASSLGTRHRAAVGITEETDSVVVVVSEETGKISIACRGTIISNLSAEKLARFLRALLTFTGDTAISDIFSTIEEEQSSNKTNNLE
jgi:diadenylate cyclase